MVPAGSPWTRNFANEREGVATCTLDPPADSSSLAPQSSAGKMFKFKLPLEAGLVTAWTKIL